MIKLILKNILFISATLLIPLFYYIKNSKKYLISVFFLGSISFFLLFLQYKFFLDYSNKITNIFFNYFFIYFIFFTGYFIFELYKPLFNLVKEHSTEFFSFLIFVGLTPYIHINNYYIIPIIFYSGFIINSVSAVITEKTKISTKKKNLFFIFGFTVSIIIFLSFPELFRDIDKTSFWSFLIMLTTILLIV